MAVSAALVMILLAGPPVEPLLREANAALAVGEPAEAGGAGAGAAEAGVESAAAEPAAAAGDAGRLEARLDALEAENRQLREDLEYLREDHDGLDQRVTAMAPLTGRLRGYVDFGLFWAGGNGSGVKPDLGYKYFPQYQGVVPDSWVFMGDPLSTAINSRGDPADTGESRQVTFDGVDSGGKTSFIVNAVNLNVFAGIGKYTAVEGLFDLVPRGRDVSNPAGLFLGDYVDVKLAYVRFQPPVKRFDLELYGGKIDPVVGYEYRIQEAPDRMTVTPSLICRYTCGRPVGVKMRARFLESRALNFALSLTNGSSMNEYFGFPGDVDRNHFKTAAGRLGYVLPVGSGLEVGASGSFGAEDYQPSDRVYQWQYAADLHLDVAGVDLTGEFVMGKLQGATEAGGPPCGVAPCLDFKGAYGLVGYRVLGWLMPYFRTDWRDAVHTSGASFVYNSQLVRFTPGVRFELGTNVTIKAEYTVNRELGKIPQFPNDVFTTSIIGKL